MDDAPRRLFVYGTLTSPHVLDEVLGRHYTGERLRATLPDYARVQVEGWEYPLIAPSPGARTEGVVIMDLAESDFVSLDAYEDVDQGAYARVEVRVQAWGCGPQAMELVADTYVIGPALARK